MSKYPDLDVQLLEQLPTRYSNVLDYQELCKAEQEQVDNLVVTLRGAADNFFFQTMDASAVSMWERVFSIVPDPLEEDLEFRRIRLLNRLSAKPPFTLGFLFQKLDELVGKGQWSVTVDYPNYAVTIEFEAKNLKYEAEIDRTIDMIKPAHIQTNRIYVSTGHLTSYHALHGGVFIEIYGSDAQKAAMTRFSGLHGGALVEVYSGTEDSA